MSAKSQQKIKKPTKRCELPHISYSELKNWCHCPYYHKLVNIDKIKHFEGNEYTAFGTALHSFCEHLLTKQISVTDKAFFIKEFRQELKSLDKDLNKKLVVSMFEQGKKIVPELIPALRKVFGDYDVFTTEEKLYEPLGEVENYLFKGYVDLVLKTKDGKYHIIDWKTCSWGWDSKKRSDKMIAYQLVLYKHYFCKKHNIDPNNVETHFALLKRTAKKDIVEVFSVTSGTKRTENALELLQRAIETIKSGVHIKNKLSCTSGYGCEFYKTQYCK